MIAKFIFLKKYQIILTGQPLPNYPEGYIFPPGMDPFGPPPPGKILFKHHIAYKYLDLVTKHLSC